MYLRREKRSIFDVFSLLDNCRSRPENEGTTPEGSLKSFTFFGVSGVTGVVYQSQFKFWQNLFFDTSEGV